MSNQPYGSSYEGYEGYDPYPQHPAQHQPQPQPQPQQDGWQGYDQSQAAHAQQYTQQWEGQTWETQLQPQAAVPANLTETAYLPPQSDGRYTSQPPAQPHPQPQPQGQTRPQSAPVAQPDPGYGPATIGGNARITDAQRARAEGRSPIIEPGMQPALITAVLGLLLAGAAAIGEYALAVPLVALQAVTAAGWFRLNGMWPARQGIVLAFAGALAADAALFAAGREHAPAAILGTLGVWVLLGIVLGLRSHADPDERMYGLMATVASAALSIIAAGYLAAVADAVAVGGVAVAVAVLARALPLPTSVSAVVSLLAAAGAGIAVGGVTELGTSGALLGGAAGLCALIGHRVASYDYPSRFVHFTAGVALPLTAAAPAVYLLGRALG
ncbi:hypothetical protein [Streptomyces ipomoeae]|uniref:hypothetical protein n=1 Tax=Streptomyces ipomoeae TaxID=103232 RepID=UPI001146EA10|nr:hypothetical protein [Streptomyces ipomoeae]MDX2938013.1 hypothetical protein [Streptomyces ipomoeae]TQE20762.1 hypothetical protein SipoB123_27720 [Streptomyces ipomoeae]TQE35670.1 hypothetical protein Sipo7851_13895 [Streptomyces ipomoeae]